MKTAVSVPDEVFEAADSMAKQMGISRSKLYTAAIVEFIEGRRSKRLTDKLNQVYSTEHSKLDAHIADMQDRSLSKNDKW